MSVGNGERSVSRDHPDTTTETRRAAATRRHRRLRGGLLALTGLVVVGSVLPIPTLGPATGPASGLSVTTLGHVVGYGLLAAGGVEYAGRIGDARVTDRTGTTRHIGIGGVVAVVLAVSLLGVGIEGLQSTIPWRTASATDAAINTASATVGSVLAVAMRFYRSRE